MSERFKVTKSEEPNTFPNYGATTGLDADDSHGKVTAETDAKQPPSSLEEAIGRSEQKIRIYLRFFSSLSYSAAYILCACNKLVVANQALLFPVAAFLLFSFCLFIVHFSFAPLLRFSHELLSM
jgi:hypothetical protein